MPKFGKESLAKLATCDERLQKIFKEVIKGIDCQVLEGHRGQKAQDAAFAAGNSKLKWPKGEHNATPSRAVDVAPWPVDWKDMRRFDFFAGYVKGTAAQMGLKVRWGGDWDSDNDLKDQKFNDLVHFEIEG